MDDKIQGSSEFKPGETIRPTNAPAQTPAPPQLETRVASPPEAPSPVASEAIVPEKEPSLESSQNPVTDYQSIEPASFTEGDPDPIAWTASEFIDHDKSFDWYLGLAVAAILTAVVLYILFRDIITSITPLVAALAMGVYGRRKPRQLQYELDSHGITIAEKFFPYEMFRSFAVMEDGPFASIAFLPLKRFGLLTTVYLDPQDEDRIIDLINQYLPFEPRDHDAVDRLMKKIRF